MNNVAGTLSFLSETVQSSTQEMKQLLTETMRSSKFKSIEDKARTMICFVDQDSSGLIKKEFDKNKKSLNSLSNSCPAFEMHIKQSEQNNFVNGSSSSMNIKTGVIPTLVTFLAFKSESGK